MNKEKNSVIENNSHISRERLYQEVWAEPMTTVAQRYKVSSSFLARICTRLNVPRPPRGYWAMFAVGRKMKQPPLPAVKPGDELEWARDGFAHRAPMAAPKPLEPTRKRRLRRDIPDRHPVFDNAKELILEGRESRYGFLKPRKHALVDVISSKDTLDRALDVANALYLSLEKRGHTVELEPLGQRLRRYAIDEREKVNRADYYPDNWSPSRSTLVLIGSVAVGLTLFEMSEYVEMLYQKGKYVRVSDLPGKKPRRYYDSSSWTSMQHVPSGRLCLQAYSPYPRAQWSRQWREVKAGDFPRKLSGVAKVLEAEAAIIVKLVEEGERKAEIERQEQEARHQEWLREKEIQRRERALQESRKELFEIIDVWAEVNKIVGFFSDAELKAAHLSDEEKVVLLERLDRARKIVGENDALELFRLWKMPEER
jgi:hypothetical protein